MLIPPRLFSASLQASHIELYARPASVCTDITAMWYLALASTSGLCGTVFCAARAMASRASVLRLSAWSRLSVCLNDAYAASAGTSAAALRSTAVYAGSRDSVAAASAAALSRSASVANAVSTLAAAHLRWANMSVMASLLALSSSCCAAALCAAWLAAAA